MSHSLSEKRSTYAGTGEVPLRFAAMVITPNQQDCSMFKEGTVFTHFRSEIAWQEEGEGAPSRGDAHCSHDAGLK